MSTTDRSALEEAIRELSNIWSKGSMVLPSGFDCTMSPAFCKRLQLVCDAASAHAETMPRPTWKVRVILACPVTLPVETLCYSQADAFNLAAQEMQKGARKVSIEAS